jgi:hypothetical protein
MVSPEACSCRGASAGKPVIDAAFAVQARSGRGARRIKPKNRQSQFRIRCFNKRAEDADPATHILRHAIDQVAEDPATVIQSHEGDHIGVSAFPFGLHGPTHD